MPWELVSAICAATDAATAGVALRVGDTDEFKIMATAGVSPEQAAILASMPVTPDNYPELRALLDGQVLAGTDRSEAAVRLDLGGGAAAPIIADGKVRGFLSITVAPGDSFDVERWQELAMGFASVAATALSRVEALAELRDQRELLASSVAERTVQLRGAIEELRSASQAKTDFLANVSHELRTPLTAILGFSEILIRGDDGPLNPRQHEDMTTVLSSGRRLLDLIDDLIDISRIEGNRLELDTQPLDLGPLLSGVVDEMRALAGAKGIGLTFTQAPDSMTVVGRPGAAPGDLPEPRLECREVHPAGRDRPGRGRHRAARRLLREPDGPDRRHRHRNRRPGTGAGANLREVPPDRGPGIPGDRAGALDRARARGPPRRDADP